LGVNAAYLQYFLEHHHKAGMLTYQFKSKFVLPATAQKQCPLVEMLGSEFVGEATVFTSHAYQYAVADTIEVMLRYARDHPGAYFWYDPFSLNQVRQLSRRSSFVTIIIVILIVILITSSSSFLSLSSSSFIHHHHHHRHRHRHHYHHHQYYYYY
jgi:hypothetical protein